ncbi:unnamed protein product, partial [Arabidopsis halleri]
FSLFSLASFRERKLNLFVISSAGVFRWLPMSDIFSVRLWRWLAYVWQRSTHLTTLAGSAFSPR